MKVIRFFDDRKVVLNNVDWESICDNDTIVEYCTFESNKKTRYIISEQNLPDKVNNWDVKNDWEYFVFLDTKWNNIPLLEKTSQLGESIIPDAIIDQLSEECVRKIIVYSSIKQEMADSLIEKLLMIEIIGLKVDKESIEIPLFDQEKIKETILEKTV